MEKKKEITLYRTTETVGHFRQESVTAWCKALGVPLLLFLPVHLAFGDLHAAQHKAAGIAEATKPCISLESTTWPMLEKLMVYFS